MNLDSQRVRDDLQAFDFKNLFIEQLSWNQPTNSRSSILVCQDQEYEQRQISQLSGVVVLEITADDGKIPNAKTRQAIHKQIAQTYHENLLIFLDKERIQSLWYWVKRDGAKRIPREHLYVKGQPGDLLISKLSAMFVDLSDMDEYGNVPVIEVAHKLQQALDVTPVTKKFFAAFREQHVKFLELISGIADERDRQWYASVLLNRLMFIYFLQRKGFIDGGDRDYLQRRLTSSRTRGVDLYYNEFLQALFFEGLAKPAAQRSSAARTLIGDIPYLNGGLFLPHPIEVRCQQITIPDTAFENLLTLFSSYTWNLDDKPGGNDNEINPDVLGYIFEKYINQKAFGAYYTRPEITEYLCERTIHRLILERVNTPAIPGVSEGRQYDSLPDLLISLDAQLCRELKDEILPGLALLDPACGSGAFLVAAMKTLIAVYSAVIGRIDFLSAPDLRRWLDKIRVDHPSIGYYIKKQIITDNLFGVDIMEEATEIARLRLFLALVSSATNVNELEPLPNIDFNILAGNSLVGLLRVDSEEYDRHNPRTPQQIGLFDEGYRPAVEEKNRKVRTYCDTRASINDPQTLQALRDDIQRLRSAAVPTLNQILLDQFASLGIKFEQATWDTARNREGKPAKRALTLADMQALLPFHWGYEFDQVMNERGGFDAIITNPPWEAFKPQGKEFFTEYSDLVSQKSMSLNDFEKEQAKLLTDPQIRAAWLAYLSRFPHLNLFFRSAAQYQHQIAIIDGKRAPADINYYKLFVEQCYNLIRVGGQVGIVVPSGIYTDRGTKGLRELLFEQNQVTGLFCFENRKEIFEGVHRSYKFVVLTFSRGSHTEDFPAAFMRHDVEGLERFPDSSHLYISVHVVRKMSPDSLSIMEFRDNIDLGIVTKMMVYPLLGEAIDGAWNISLNREFHMTDDFRRFKPEPGDGRLPLYEGKMIHQFTDRWAEIRYWVGEAEGRAALLGRRSDSGQQLGYQIYRLAFRDVARSTDERTMIATVLPPRVFAVNTLNLSQSLMGADLLAAVGLLNSYPSDFMIRLKVSAHCNMFYVYQLPIPRMRKSDPNFCPIVERAARLICTTAEFDALAREAGLRDHRDGVTDPLARARLRAELDGIIAHVYGLTEAEFAHILSAFPLVADPIKVAAQNAYRDVERGLVQ